ncbi:MAG: alcohol dehydrogenase, partial [Oscillospiraceae bacterium]
YGSRNAMKDDFLEVIDYVKEGKINLDSIVSKEYSFEDAGQAFHDMATKGGELLKLVLKF